MEYLIELLREELDHQNKLGYELADLEAESMDPTNDLDNKLIHDESHHAANHEAHLKTAMSAYKRMHEVEDSEIADLIYDALEEGYESNARVVVAEDGDYKGLAEMLSSAEEKVDAVIMYGNGRVFDPKIASKWEDHNIKPGSKIIVYLHNEDGVSIDDVVDYIGDEVETPEVEVFSEKDGGVEIVNQYGIHVRPAVMIAKMASEYNCEISFENSKRKVSGKSIMGLMTLEASKGTYVKITAEGSDAEKAIEELTALVQSKFNNVDG